MGYGNLLLTEKKEQVFHKYPFASELKTHKLTGLLKGFWSFSIDYQYRIIFEFKDKNIVWFYLVGTHEVYRR